MKLGKIISLLERQPQDNNIYFDFGGFTIDDLDSYRGYYRDLAISYLKVPYDKTPKVKDFLEKCKQAVGRTYDGYKGDKFLMDENTPVWIDNYSECNGVQISHIESDGSFTYLHTSKIE